MTPFDFRGTATQPATAPPDARGGPRLPPRLEPSGARRRAAGPISEKVRLTIPLAIVYTLWATVLMDPQHYIASKGPDFVLRIPQFIFLVLAAVTLRGRVNRGVAPYFAGFMIVGVLALPGAYDNGLARDILKSLLLLYILTVGTLTVVRRVHEAVPIVMLLLFQYIWWGLHGALAGLVSWHPANGNYDGYGPLMVMGLALCYYFGLAATSKRIRIVALALAGVCVLGVVASFARGAVLSAGLVGLILWLRSPRKGRATVAAVGAAIVVSVGSAVLHPDGAFWTEMQTVFTEGSQEGTRGDRKVLWGAAIKVYQARPVVGTGFRNFGRYAAAEFDEADVGGNYAANVGRLADRSLHSIYLQVLSESGTLGSLMFLLMLGDFFRRNRMLQRKPFGKAWASGTQRFKLKPLALGLESAMVAYLASGFFYDQLFGVHWLYTLLAANLLLFSVTQAAMRTVPVTGRSIPRRSLKR